MPVVEQGGAGLGDLERGARTGPRVAAGPGGSAPVEEPEPVHDGQDAAQGTVDERLGDAAVEHGLLEGVGEVVAARHLHVEPGGEGGDGAVGGEPVGHDPAVEAPVVAQDVAENWLVLAGEGPVHLVVRAHHGARSGGYGRFEAAEFEFAQGLFGDPHVDGHAVLLLVVQGEVLDGGDEALALDAADLLGDQVRAEQRILGEGLVVASGVRGPDQVDHGRQEDVLAEGAALAADDLAVLAGERGVEGGGQQHGGRQRGRVGGDADPGRSVGESERRDREPGHTGDVAGLAEALGIVRAVQEADLLVQSEAGDQRFHPAGGRGGPERAGGGGEGAGRGGRDGDGAAEQTQC